MTVQHNGISGVMDAIDKFIMGESVGEPVGILPKHEWPEGNIMTPQQFDDLAAALEGQLCEKAPLIAWRVARWQNSCDGGMPPSVLSITGEVTVNGKLLRGIAAVAVKMWQAWQAHVGEYPLEFLVHRIADGIAKAIIEWRPKEASQQSKV